MDAQPPEITPIEAHLFPISAESVDKGLSEISQAPDKVLAEEHMKVEIEDPELAKLISVLGDSQFVNLDLAFFEGALWLRKIIKIQATSMGIEMPKLSHEAGVSYLVSNLEKLKGSGTSVHADFLHQVEGIKESDPEIYRGIQEMARFKASRVNFLGGAATTYYALKRMEESDKLSKSLKF